MTVSALNYQSLTVTVPCGEQVHLTRFYKNKKQLGMPVFMLHGLLEDGTAFYDENGKGLACYMAQQGYDVYVADLRGKGHSWPAIQANSQVGVHQHITEDIPALLKKIQSIRGNAPQIWLGHGWGSVLLTAYYARNTHCLAPVAQMLHLGARRQTLLSTPLKRFVFNTLWRRLGGLGISLNGYLPSRFLCLGDCKESSSDYQDYLSWSLSDAWLDPKDGFDYGAAITNKTLPPSLYVASVGDAIYGDVVDARSFMRQLGPHDGRMLILDKKAGSLNNYKHNELLKHADAEQDHFPHILAWLNEYQQSALAG
ncbi:alpha/beta fold hydrolase [Dasania sp. GY-MA-18]|uniref:Alpha/beta fold hydrolase n=1 Tax=Dasania phycosphaerae TaxID=2950436 RepID=A0A9J6RPM3_9GAMM|nr:MULTISPECIES: alpha/beta fold hydrolase [Dasania]MCR8923547.1 alpha/beta fold hydrolase [Dasania sp. GY-MA-18]MCZ0865981.1 alpha/beta fold hydrolase [Dasania phycosphaerae]MCZ0869705.1 alpha/beta fold hydrolase [Dasania phycosphaerae]